jgi:cytochrome b involved in lipid metabolism
VMAEFTREQVATHTAAKSAWIIIDSLVYDISSFAALHPGGEKLILEYAGQDVTGTYKIKR